MEHVAIISARRQAEPPFALAAIRQGSKYIWQSQAAALPAINAIRNNPAVCMLTKPMQVYGDAHQTGSEQI